MVEIKSRYTGEVIFTYDGDTLAGAGFQYCTLHNKPLTLTPDGWQVCCKECTTPIQVKEQS